jgi:hypothetical protein
MHCYVCGKPIENDFTLVAPKDGDQWRVIHRGDCALQVKEDWVFVPVRRIVQVRKKP